MSFDKFLVSIVSDEERQNDLIFCELTDYFGDEDENELNIYLNRSLINIIHDYCVVEYISKDEENLRVIKNNFESVLNSEIDEYKRKIEEYKAKYLQYYRELHRITEEKESKKRSRKGSKKYNSRSSSRKGSRKNTILKKIKIRKLIY